MLTVPKSNVVPLAKPKVDPIYLAMAAATVHEQGRLFEPDVDVKSAMVPPEEPKPNV